MLFQVGESGEGLIAELALIGRVLRCTEREGRVGVGVGGVCRRRR